MAFGVAVLASILSAAFAGTSSNMNGKYSIASGAHQDVPFNDDYGSKGYEYFDVYSPEIATHYGEAFWTNMGNQAFPPEIVARFRGKVMAIVGYEHDQVMVSPTGSPGVNPAKDVSVPINWAYNHHYGFTATGAHSTMVEKHVDPGHPMAHGAETMWVAVDLPSATGRPDISIPTSTDFSEGNGGESRKSYHGYPKGFAQLIDSPNAWHLTPMQVDTRNRDCGVQPEDVGNCTNFMPGPEPKQARYGRGKPKDTLYSGLLECPCNEGYGGDPVFYPDAKTKIVSHTYGLRASGTCADGGAEVANAANCFAAAASVGINASKFVNLTVSDVNLPPACSVVVQKNGSASVYFNADGKASCASGEKKIGQATSAGVTLSLEIDSTGLFKRSAKGAYCANNEAAKIKRFDLKSSLGADAAAVDSRDRCEQFCMGESTCWGCSVDCAGGLAYGYGPGKDCAWNAISSCGTQKTWDGSAEGDISEKQLSGGLASITVSGPAGVWFGVGFNATIMGDMPYTFLVNASGVIEQKIGTCTDEGKHCPGTQLKPSVTVKSNVVANGVRTVVMTRPLQGLTKDHYSFDPQIDTIPLLTAVGYSPVFAHHKTHGNTKVSFTAVGTPTCVCDLGTKGKLCHTGGTDCKEFTKNCLAGGPLIAQKNPTCNSIQYSGGLNCCVHKHIMLDVAQAEESMKRDVLRYHVKIRFWFQEYKVTGVAKASHVNLNRIYYQTEAWATEYDVPPPVRTPDTPAIVGYPDWPMGKLTPGTSCTGTCPSGSDCKCVHTITLAWMVSNIRVLYAGGHCHAPSCIGLNLYVNDTKTGNMTLLCEQIPKYGQGNVATDRFDEKGYLALPPCLWSDDPSEGLQKSVWLPENTQLVSIKRNHNTNAGHFGEMASWQMRGVNFPTPQPDTFV